MIISHRHRFIFIKNRKTGGTSVELALSKICGPDDVLTPDMIHRSRRDVLRETARHFEGAFSPAREILSDPRPLSVARAVRDWRSRPKFYNHMRANSVRCRIPPETWDGYYKFCFDRNPWDKTISYYYWSTHRNEAPKPFAEALKGSLFSTVDQRLPTDWERYALGDRIIVDDVFDFADLEGNLRLALARAGVGEKIVQGVELPKLKSDVRKKGGGIRYDAETDELIRKHFAREIAHFGYEAPERLLEAPPAAA